MRDDVEWHASSDEKMAEIDRKLAVARRYLERTTPHHDPIFDLPLARTRWVKHLPDFVDKGERACGASARAEEIPAGGPYQPSIVVRSMVRCQLAVGHDGPHAADGFQKMLGDFRIWVWGTTSHR